MKEIVIIEGRAKLKIPNPALYVREDRVIEPTWAPIFYNPLMVFNRDVSVLALATFMSLRNLSKGIIVDALSGSGVRAIRYCLEVIKENSGIECLANDISRDSVSVILKNAELNNLLDVIRVSNDDANALLYRLKYRSEGGKHVVYVDIDPFGSAAPFVRSSIFSVRNGGLVGYTSTDVATLSGLKWWACRRRYDVLISRNDIGDEVGLRILLGFIARRAAEADRYIDVLLAFKRLYYYRVFVRPAKSATKANEMLEKKLGYIVMCRNCGYRAIIPYTGEARSSIRACPICSSTSLDIIGPLWVGELADKEFLEHTLNLLRSEYRYLQTYHYIKQLITEIAREAYLSIPFNIVTISKWLGINQPKVEDVIKCLSEVGYESVKPHYGGPLIKTNAEFSDLVSCVKYCSR